MNLDKEDWAKMEASFQEMDRVLKEIWIDPDYSQEQDYRSKVREIIDDTRTFVRRYFRNN